MAACRWGVFVEMAMPTYQRALQDQAMNVPRTLTADALGQALRAKVAAAKIVREWEPILYPKDGHDGG